MLKNRYKIDGYSLIIIDSLIKSFSPRFIRMFSLIHLQLFDSKFLLGKHEELYDFK